ncbi:hypothetical protein GCM10007389_39800 [Pontibacter akesuensis]|nr:hypothetical protein GCM10007389_39800 [Pontibacter akesuensis]
MGHVSRGSRRAIKPFPAEGPGKLFLYLASKAGDRPRSSKAQPPSLPALCALFYLSIEKTLEVCPPREPERCVRFNLPPLPTATMAGGATFSQTQPSNYMAKIIPCDIGPSTDCYAAVSEGEHGFICGRLHGWRLHDLRNPWVRRTLDRNPDQVVAAFETRQELEQWLATVHAGPSPGKGAPPASLPARHAAKGMAPATLGLS